MKRFCESVKLGYYFVDNEYSKRVYYLTGTLKGNKWIDLKVPNPKWMSLMWTCINEEMLENSTYYENNPISIKI